MSKALVVCPATDQLELIDYLDSPLGALIHACSRFRPAHALACGRMCAPRDRTELAKAVGAAFETGELDPDGPDGPDWDDDTAIDVAPCTGCRSR